MLLEIRNLTVEFESAQQRVLAVDGASLSIDAGQVVGLVGESGSGKTTLGLAITRLIPEPPAVIRSGEILFDGQDLLRLGQQALSRVRGGRIAYVFQEPSTSLNPVMTIGRQLMETIELHTPHRGDAAVRQSLDSASLALARDPSARIPRPQAEGRDSLRSPFDKLRASVLSRVEGRSQALEWLGRVGIPAPAERLSAYPHELSGGMKQRVMIAMAIASRPALLVADEPTTALDVTLERQIVGLLKRLQRELGLSLLVISHSIHLVKQLADRLAVMWQGRLVEEGSTAQVLAQPTHEYTKRLLAAQPRVAALERP